jgi:DNA/RNA endonuclease YhcR with UshA esterase domain
MPAIIYSGSFTVSFKNEHIIYENEVRCIVKESEYNLSYNPTLTTNYGSGSLKSFATSSTFYPYATTIGLYNDDNELLAVAKFGKPLMISPDTDMTFVVKYDI